MGTVVLIPSKSDHGGLPTNLVKLDIGDNCLVCGKPREITRSRIGKSHDGSRVLYVDLWVNKCGCTETYARCREKGTVVPRTTISINEKH